MVYVVGVLIVINIDVYDMKYFDFMFIGVWVVIKVWFDKLVILNMKIVVEFKYFL